ncbi:hypothetical protein [Gemmobacter aquaticus]|uniref:hypothetical protein n=1 Tax=Gemmobacter aquaticus TaxID=490185 RepID=UPI0013157CE6|nr:hypothetical protein [Gemmobacter aquaticus]
MASSDLTSPQAARALFWRARYLQESPILQHLPFLFWLLSILRPRRYVEINMTEAVSYFAACQAMDKIEPDAVCTGIWHQTGGKPATIPEGILWRNSEFYAEFSQILTEPPAKVASRIHNGSVDLLLVNLQGDDTPMNSLVQDWTCKLSERAVVLVHGTGRPGFEETPGAVLLRDLGARCPTVHFDGGDGLSVLLWGTERQERFQGLANLAPETPDYFDVRQVFQRLGAAHRYEWKSRKDSQRLHEQQRSLDRLQKENTELSRDLEERTLLSQEHSLQVATLRAQLHDLEMKRKAWEDTAKQRIAALEAEREEQSIRRQEAEAGREERFREIAVLTSTLEKERERTQRSVEERTLLIQEHSLQVTTLQAQLHDLEMKRKAWEDTAKQRIAALEAEREEQSIRRQEAEAGREERFREIAVLTSTLEKERERTQRSVEERTLLIQEHSLQVATLQAQLHELEMKRKAWEDEAKQHLERYNAVINSTSWCITRPARRAIDRFRALNRRRPQK